MKLKNEYVLLKKLEWLKDDYVVYKDVMCSINKTPTVEAIPVEWIEKRIDSYIQFYKEKEKREPALALSISHSINAISELLDDWREENEI